MPLPSYAIGLDYGTSSVRALVVRCADGAEIGESVWPYAQGDEGVIGDPANPHLARQHPQDYIDGLFASVEGALAKAGEDCDFRPENVVGIGVDTTGSTPIPVDSQCRPLANDARFQDNLNAMAWLWKDHTGTAEAAEITERANAAGLPYMSMVGGTYSSEWFWSKVWRCLRADPKAFDAAASWIELADFIPAYLAGVEAPSQAVRDICAAGHKALFNPDWGGLPSAEFLRSLDSKLASLRPNLYDRALSSDREAGRLSLEVALKLGLPAGIPIATGAFDAHMGAVGSGVKPGTLVKIIGTSTCDIMVAPAPADGKLPFIPGMCGVVKGSVIPGMLGIEAGQSAVGDLFNWFVKELTPSAYFEGDAHANLSREAFRLRPGESGLLALDWNNGNRTVLVDQRLTGLIIGQTLRTTAPAVYRALVEATAFGALTIIRRMEEYGANVGEIVNCGGIAEKSALVMQIYADVTNRPMKISRSGQTCALGAALFASVVGGAHPDVAVAQAAMTGTKDKVYEPNSEAHAVYARLYDLYLVLHDSFGGRSVARDLGGVMKELLKIQSEAMSHKGPARAGV